MSKHHITADCEYVCGHLRYGHYELELDDKDLEVFEDLPLEEQIQWLRDDGNLIIDSYEVDDIADPSLIVIHD